MVMLQLLLVASLAFPDRAAAFVDAYKAGDPGRITAMWSQQSPTRVADLKRIQRLLLDRGGQTVEASVDDSRQTVRLTVRDTGGRVLQQYDVLFRDDGIWSIEVAEPEDDVQRARALLLRAAELLENGEVDRAVTVLQAAHEHAQRSDHAPTRAAAERGLGNIPFIRGDSAAARRHFETALEISRAANDRSGTGRALDKLAALDRLTGDVARAEARFTEALAIFRSTGERMLEAYMLNGLGNLHSGSRGDYQRAAAHYREALAIFEELGDVTGMTTILNNLAVNLRLLGRYRETVSILTRSLEMSRAAGDLIGMSYLYGNLGRVLTMQGKLNEAVQALEQALALHERLQRNESIVLTLTNIGELYLLVGNYEQARAHFQRARSLAEKQNFKSALASTLHHLGRLRLEEEDPRAAIALFDQALAIDTELGQRAGVTRDLYNLGKAQLLAGDRAAARQSIEKSLAIAEELGAREWITLALGVLSTLAAEPGEAVALSRRAVELAAELGVPEHLWNAHLAHGRALRRAGSLIEARPEIERAVTIVEAFRRGVPGGEIAQQQAFENLVEPFHEMTSLLVQQGDVAAAFEYAERAKARVLLDVLQNGRPDLASLLTAEERTREEALAAEVAQLNRKYRAALVDGKPTGTLPEQLRKARLAYDAFLTNVHAAHPQLRAERGEVAPLQATGLRTLLGNGTADALVEFVVTDQRTYVFAATKNELRVRTIEVSRRELESQVQQFRKLLASHDLTYAAPARALYDRLIAPVAAQLHGKTTVCIVPDGPLWELPFQALQPDETTFLLDRHAIYTVPSLSVLREMSSRKRASATRLLAFGDPLIAGSNRPAVFRDEPLAPLPHTETEVRAIASLYGPGNARVHLRGDAREEVVKAEAGTFDVIHFATHGILDDQNALYSRLVFSPPASQSEDGLLEAREIMRLDLRADLAVLSACETARGRVSTGEGVIGMSWALFVAGVPATVVSQWKVDSASTSELMIELHRNLRVPGRSKAEALRRAALKTRTKYRHPFYWAPFVVVGSAR